MKLGILFLSLCKKYCDMVEHKRIELELEYSDRDVINFV